MWKISKDISFEDWVKDKTFPSETSDEDVKFESLSKERQKQIRETYRKKQQRAKEETAPEKKSVSEKAEVKGSKIDPSAKVGDNAKLHKVNVHNKAVINDADIQNSNIMGGRWNDGQKVKRGTWGKDHDQESIDFLEEKFPGGGDSPVRMIQKWMRAGGNPKSGLLRSRKKILKNLREYSNNDLAWRFPKYESHEMVKPVMDIMDKMSDEDWDKLVSIAKGNSKKAAAMILRVAKKSPQFRRELIKNFDT